MPTFKLVYYEVIKLTQKIQAKTIEDAIAVGNSIEPREAKCPLEVESLGTDGVEEVYDNTGDALYNDDLACEQCRQDGEYGIAVKDGLCQSCIDSAMAKRKAKRKTK